MSLPKPPVCQASFVQGGMGIANLAGPAFGNMSVLFDFLKVHLLPDRLPVHCLVLCSGGSTLWVPVKPMHWSDLGRTIQLLHVLNGVSAEAIG